MAIRVRTDGSVRRNLREFGDLTLFSLGTLRQLPRSARYASEIIQQLAILIRGTTLLLAILSLGGAFGLANFGYYFLKSAGAADYVGLLAGIGIPRATVGMFFGYLFAAKVGCGLVAEIGTMRINQELDAYETEGVGAQRYVIGPRVIAALLYTPIAAAVSLVVQMFACFAYVVYVLRAVSAETFYRYAWGNQAVFDQIFAYSIVVLLAMTIVLVSTFYGFRASGGPAGVGDAVARSLIVNLVLVHVILGVTATLVYKTDLGLPIGG